MNRPLVSVIMPVFNAERYLRDSLVSILNQTYKNMEVIIVDDECTDASMEIINAFNDPRITIIRNAKNLGLAACLNKAIQSSKGSFLARMDADDSARPERIAKQVEFLEANPGIDIVGSSMRYFGYSDHLHVFPETHEECRIQLLFNVCFGHPTVVFRKNVFDMPENFYDEALKQYSEEYDLWCRLANRYRFHNLKEVLLDYRTYPPDIKTGSEEKRKKNSLVIRQNYLIATLGTATAQELALHARMSMMEKVRTREDLLACDQWLNKIADLNRQRQIFHGDRLVRRLARLFFELCYHNSGRGFFSLGYYYSSPWSAIYKPPLQIMAKFVLKSILKK